jgi:hypothetical protein
MQDEEYKQIMTPVRTENEENILEIIPMPDKSE